MANIRATDETASELRKLTGRLVAETGASPTLSEVLGAAIVVTNGHLPELISAYRAATAKS